MAKRGSDRGGGKQGANWPAKTNDGKKSGKGRDNNPPKSEKK